MATTSRNSAARKRARPEVMQVCVFILDIEEQNGDLLLYGATRDRTSVIIRVSGFQYSFFLEIPELVNSPSGLSAVHLRQVKERLGKVEIRIETVRRKRLVCYRREPEGFMLRVYQSVPKGTAAILKAFTTQFGRSKVRAYETQVDIVNRFGLDSGIRCGYWLSFQSRKCDDEGSRRSNGSTSFGSNCDLSYTAEWDNVAGSLSINGKPVSVHSFGEHEWADIPTMRVLTFSIQRFPTSISVEQWPEEPPDPIRAVSTVLTNSNGISIQSKQRMLLFNTDSLPKFAKNGKAQGQRYGPWTVRYFASERELLEGFQELVLQEDPSLIVGFEPGESLRIMLSRAESLGMKNWGHLSRRPGTKISVKSRSTYTAKWAKQKLRAGGSSNQEFTEVACSGRIILDALRVFIINEALRLYSLNEISMHALGETFEMLSAKQVESLLESEGKQDVGRAMANVFAPADLALEIVSRKNIITELVELSRVMGLPLSDVYTRGQMARVLSLLLTHSTRQGIVIPATAEELDKTPLQQTAMLIDPMPLSAENPEGIGTAGLRRAPVAVFDFTSLYPSIMIAHNICYSTLIKNAEELDDTSTFFTTPTNARFVGEETRKGVIPELQKELLASRRDTQKVMKSSCTKDVVRRVLDARQKAYKVVLGLDKLPSSADDFLVSWHSQLCANALYGFFGSSVNSLSSRELGDSILSLGREYFDRVSRWVSETHPDLKVIYGDTDSIFVEYPTEQWTVKNAQEHAESVLTPAINKILPHAVQMKMEKVFSPLLLQHIRRYAGFEWSTDAKTKKLEIRGMEAVQRNNMELLVRCMKTSLSTLFETNDIQAVKDNVRSFVKHMMMDRCDLYELMWTRGLWRLGEYDAKVPHVALTERLEKEDPRRQFRVGERVPYVLVQRSSDAPLYRKAEHPPFALTHSNALDLDEYLKQLKLPMVRLLSLIMSTAEAEDLFKGSNRVLQTGKSSAASNTIGKFFSRSIVTQCLGCRARLPTAASTPLCSECQNAPWRALLPLSEQKDEAARQYQRAYRHCQRCQRGGASFEVICDNETCPVMYRREKYKLGSSEVGKRLEEVEIALVQNCQSRYGSRGYSVTPA